MFITLNRKSCFLLHLLFSVIVISVITAFAVSFWFPPPFYWIDGTLTIAVVIALVDIVLGPLVTLVISSEKKPTKILFKDIAVIILIQLSALFYGVHQLYQERVVGMVLFGGAFHLLPGRHYTNEELSGLSLPQFKGVFYSSLPESAVRGSTSIESHQKMINLRQHSLINQDAFILDIPYDKIPKPLAALYEPDLHRFIPIAGKAKNGVAVLNKQLEIVDVAVQ